MTENDRAGTEQDELGLGRTLKAAAGLPAPPDLADRMLNRAALPPQRQPAPMRTRRIWSTVGVAAAVAAVAIGVTAVTTSNRTPAPAPVAAPATAPPAAASTAGPASAAAASAGPVDPVLPRGDYQSWAGQTVPCGGIDPVAGTDQALLNPAAGGSVASVLICDTTEAPVEGDGVWLMAGERELAPAQIPALVRALTAENVPIDPAAMCTADLVSIPNFALVLDDGRVVRPGVPGDGCHPSRDAATILVPTGDVSTDTQVRQLRTQAMVATGCEPAMTPYWDPFSSGGTGTRGERPKASAATGASLCSYRASGDSPETMTADLVALGTPSPAALNRALAAVLTAAVKPAAACTAEQNTYRPADVGWLTVVVPVPASDGTDSADSADSADSVDKPGTALSLLSIERGGCHRVLADDGTGWFAPAAAVNALVALADQPVVLK